MGTVKKEHKQAHGRCRQKIEIKPIETKSHLQVTFSKRRGGLVKKASELSLLCGAQVAVLTFSPGKKAFSFGHPNVDTVLERYLNETCHDSQSNNSGEIIEAYTNRPQVQQWNRELGEVAKELDEEKQLVAEIIEKNKDESDNDINAPFWWEGPIDDMGLEELEEYVRALQELKNNVDARADELKRADDEGLN